MRCLVPHVLLWLRTRAADEGDANALQPPPSFIWDSLPLCDNAQCMTASRTAKLRYEQHENDSWALLSRETVADIGCARGKTGSGWCWRGRWRGLAWVAMTRVKRWKKAGCASSSAMGSSSTHAPATFSFSSLRGPATAAARLRPTLPLSTMKLFPESAAPTSEPSTTVNAAMPPSTRFFSASVPVGPEARGRLGILCPTVLAGTSVTQLLLQLLRAAGLTLNTGISQPAQRIGLFSTFDDCSAALTAAHLVKHMK